MSEFLDQSIGFHINRAALALKRHLQNMFNMHQFDITTEQWAVLNRLSKKDGKTQSEIAETTFKDNANITRIIDQLDKKGLAYRENAPNDRRVRLIFLSQKGDKMLQELIPLAEKVVEKATNGITKEEQDKINGLAQKIVQNLN